MGSDVAPPADYKPAGDWQVNAVHTFQKLVSPTQRGILDLWFVPRCNGLAVGRVVIFNGVHVLTASYHLCEHRWLFYKHHQNQLSKDVTLLLNMLRTMFRNPQSDQTHPVPIE